jgi:hypothetical protein
MRARTKRLYIGLITSAWLVGLVAAGNAGIDGWKILR